MQLSDSSVKILKASERPAFFSVKVSNGIVDIIGKSENIVGDLIIFGTSKSLALDIVAENSGSLKWVFFVDDKFNIEVIGEPDIGLQSDIDEVFNRIFRKGFKRREEQLKIAHFVYDVFESREIGIIEAPTGTGKSLSYLVPAIIFSRKYKSKVVVSTNTINLQKQLINKDIPFLSEFLNFKVEIALGRNNYLCKRKAEKVLQRGDIFLFEEDLYKDIKEFLEETEEGTRGDFFSKNRNVDERVWSAFESSSISCAHRNCPHYKKDCFFYRARRRLKEADIIVANHHLVLSNSIMENAEILPNFDVLIFDEAHNIEKNATNYYTQTFNSRDVVNLINMLYSRKRTESGLLVGFASSELKEKVELIKAKMLNTFDEISLSLDSEVRISKNNLKAYRSYILRLLDLIDELLIELKPILSELGDENVDVKSVYTSLAENSDILRRFLSVTNDNSNIFWIKKFKRSIHFNITPIYINSALREFIYDKVSSVVFVSATLAVNGSFDFFKNSIGVNESCEFLAKTSFDYENNCRLLVVKDMPTLEHKDFPEYAANVLFGIASSIKGRMGVLVLFTSYEMLNKIYKKSVDKLVKLGFNVFRQGELDNFELLSRFKRGRGFLFATSSFWEGIDVKGEELSVLVVTRLPFEVPTSPIEKARFELFKFEGKDAFIEYSLPKAVLKFKQGIGRLIRDENDRGVVVVLDNRIIHKNYGAWFLKSVDYIKHVKVCTNEIEKIIGDFFGGFS